jgi:3-deoxy-manno-octulosonate cytidylyltransferase (CMP-KDO synthetase)
MEFNIIIPARLNSTRLKEKALLKIKNKTMLQHVYERGLESGAERVIIATDNKSIAQEAESFGASVCMTSSDHQSGTERLAEAVVALGFDDNDIIVNLQGDMPLIPPSVVKAAANDLDQHDNVKVSTIAVPIQNTEELFNPDVVKVVMTRRNYALYFSRAPIPWDRDQFNHDQKHIKLKNLYFRHVGIYAYRAGFLNNYMEAEPSPYTSIEALEQLQILWHGGRIHVLPSKEKIPHSVDTQKDLEKMRVLFEKK